MTTIIMTPIDPERIMQELAKVMSDADVSAG